MSKLPQDYINFIAKGIVHNLKAGEIPIKDNYDEQDLMFIFDCKTPEELYQKINDIEEKTITALGLPVKDSYTFEELETALNLASEKLASMENVLNDFPEINK